MTGLVPAGSIVAVGPPWSPSAESWGSTPISIDCCVNGALPGAWTRLNAPLKPPAVEAAARARSSAAPLALLPAMIVLVMFAEPLLVTVGLPVS